MSCFNNEQAKELWKSRWQRVPIKKLVAKYGADPRRFYEVWSEETNPGSRLEALSEFTLENPDLASAIDPQPHQSRLRVVPKPNAGGEQKSLFN